MSTIGIAKTSTDVQENRKETIVKDENKGTTHIVKINNIPMSASTKDWRFWSILASLGVTAILAAIDGTIITTALPSIAAALSSGEKYIQVIAAYFLSRV
jgi:hypothetical protein